MSDSKASDSETSALIVDIDPRGAGAPLFCVHPVGGSVFCYWQLSRALGGRRPVRAIQSPGMAGAALPDTVAVMAALYVRAIRARRPRGPYALAGWSMGGLIAHEMARLLSADGDAVALAMLDTAPRLTDVGDACEHALLALWADMLLGGKPPSVRPEELRDAIASLARPDRGAPDASDRAVAAALAVVNARGGNAVGLDVATARGLYRVFRHNLLAEARHTPRAYAGRALLVRAAAPLPGFPPERDYGWSALCGPLAVHEVPGGHYDIVQEPAVGEVARYLCEHLAHLAG